MKKSMVKFVVALLTLTVFIGGVSTAYAAEARSPYPETETVSKTSSRTDQGCSLKLTATATIYLLDHVEAGSYYLTPSYPGTFTYQTITSETGWNRTSGTSITCTGKGLFIPNSSANGFYLTPSITFAI